MPPLSYRLKNVSLRSILSSPEPKAQRRAYSIGRSVLSSLVVRCNHSLNIFSETNGLIESKFHMGPLAVLSV